MQAGSDKAQLEELVTGEEEDGRASTLAEAREKCKRERQHDKHCVEV